MVQSTGLSTKLHVESIRKSRIYCPINTTEGAKMDTIERSAFAPKEHDVVDAEKGIGQPSEKSPLGESDGMLFPLHFAPNFVNQSMCIYVC
jgi:hypothetical protein